MPTFDVMNTPSAFDDHLLVWNKVPLFNKLLVKLISPVTSRAYAGLLRAMPTRFEVIVISDVVLD
jgi:hypothetical protein